MDLILTNKRNKNMRSQFLKSISFILFLTSLFSCSDNEVKDVAENKGPKEVRFFMTTARPGSENTPITRTATDIYMNTNFVKGDSVGIFVYERNSEGGDGSLLYSNMKYVYDGSNWISSSGEKIIVEGDQELNYYAYCPYDKGIIDYKTINHETVAEQNVKSESGNADNYNMSDFLYVKNCELPAGTEVVGLAFNHAMSMVQVRLTGTLATDPNTTIQLLNLKNSSVIDLSSDEKPIADKSSESISVDMLQLDATTSKMVYRAVVPAQNIDADTEFLAVKFGDKYQAYSYNELLPLNSGAARVLNIVLGEPTEVITDVDMGGFDINPWETDPSVELTPGGIKDVEPDPEVGNLMTIPFSLFTNFAEYGTVEGWPSGDTSMWWYKSNLTTTDSKLSVNMENHDILGTACRFSSQDSDPGRGIGFYFADGPYESGKYKLTFCGALINGKNRLNVGLSYGTGDSKISFAGYDESNAFMTGLSNTDNYIGADYSSKMLKYDKVTADNMKHTIIFDLSKQYTDINTASDVDIKSFDNLVLRFALGTGVDGAFYISNVWLEKIE